ncbi:MAG TPA: NlpC/P60 family protein [Armatimonadota bacterium]
MHFRIQSLVIIPALIGISLAISGPSFCDQTASVTPGDPAQAQVQQVSQNTDSPAVSQMSDGFVSLAQMPAEMTPDQESPSSRIIEPSKTAAASTPAQPAHRSRKPAKKRAAAPIPAPEKVSPKPVNEIVVSMDSQSPESSEGYDQSPVESEGIISRVVNATRGLIDHAVSWLGTRYVWGGTSRRGIDCSGLTRILYGAEGVNLPHKAKLQFRRGQVVAKNSLLPGDLVFFNTRGPISHVGIYIGDGKFLHAANPRKGVRIDSIGSPYYSKRYAGARRYKDFSDVG